MLKKASIILGILLILIGIFCIVNPLVSAVTLGWLLGLLLALAGLNLLIFGLKFEPKPILTIIFGVLILISGLTTMCDSIKSFMAVSTLVTISNIFLLFGGVSRIAEAIQMKRYEANWRWMLFVGILCVLAACFLLANPLSAVLVKEIVLAVTFITQGICLVVMGIALPKI